MQAGKPRESQVLLLLNLATLATAEVRGILFMQALRSR